MRRTRRNTRVRELARDGERTEQNRTEPFFFKNDEIENSKMN
jgi:hypothetical protein